MRTRFLALWMACAAVYFIAYSAIDRHSAGRPAHTLFLPGEERIPLVPTLAYVYALGFPLPLLLVWAAPDARRFARAAAAFGAVVVAAFAIFLVFPVTLARPPAAGALKVAWVDGPYNCFPSLHVAICCLVWLSCRDTVRHPKILFAVVAAITASTLLVKQHYLADVAAGAVFAWAAWRLTGWLEAGRA